MAQMYHYYTVKTIPPPTNKKSLSIHHNPTQTVHLHPTIPSTTTSPGCRAASPQSENEPHKPMSTFISYTHSNEFEIRIEPANDTYPRTNVAVHMHER